jgi:hypothetical protein
LPKFCALPPKSLGAWANLPMWPRLPRLDDGCLVTNWTGSGIPALPGQRDAYTFAHAPKIAGEVAKLPQ